MGIWVSYLILGFTLAIPVGPVNIEMMKQGIERGFLSSFIVGLGDVFSNVCILLFIYFGLAQWLDIHWIRTTVSIFGGFILIYMGLISMKQKLYVSFDFYDKLNLFIKGLLLGISNPFDFVSWLGIYSTISNQQSAFLITTLAFMLIGTWLWNFLLSLSIHWSRNYISSMILYKFTLIARVILIIFGLTFIYKGFIPS